MNVVGKNIKAQRLAQGMTQEALAEKMFVTRQTISNWETGKSQPDLETLSAISELFSVEPTELIYGAKKPYQKYQKKYIVIAAISLCVVVAAIILEFTLYPQLRAAFIQTFRGSFELNLYLFSVRPLGFFALGVFLLSFLSLWTDTRLERSARIVVLIIGILLFILPIWILVEMILIFQAPQVFPGFILFSKVFTSQYLRVVFMAVFPLLAGAGLFMGWKRK